MPQEQPRRALTALLVWAVLGGAGAVTLVQLQGPFLGGVLAVMWLEALAVPLAVVGLDRTRGGE